MSDVQVNDRDPYEFYRDDPPDINDPKLREELQRHPWGGDRGEELHVKKHITSDQLKELNDEAGHQPTNSRTEEIREVLRRRGIDTPNPRGRTYHYFR